MGKFDDFGDDKSRIDNTFSTKLLKKIRKVIESDKSGIKKYQKVEKILTENNFHIIHMR